MKHGVYQRGTFSGAWEQFWPDDLPASTTDSWVPAGVESMLAGRKSVA